MKNKGLIIGLISFLSILVIGLTVLFILLLNGKINFKNLGFFSKKSTTVIAEKQYDGTINSIKIDSDVTDITIKNSDTNELKVVVYGDKKNDSIDIDNDGDKLDIKFKGKKCHFICINRKVGSIEISVPNGYGKNIKIKNDTGDIKIENSVASLKIENDIGDIKVKSVGKDIDIRNDVGDIKIGDLNITSDSKIRNDIGDIEIEYTQNVKIDAKTDVGEKEINGNDKNSSVDLEIRNDVGDIIVN